MNDMYSALVRADRTEARSWRNWHRVEAQREHAGAGHPVIHWIAIGAGLFVGLLLI
jgi:hypothetical protein